MFVNRSRRLAVTVSVYVNQRAEPRTADQPCAFARDLTVTEQLRPYAFVAGLPGPVRVSAFLFFAANLADGVLLPFFAIWAVRQAGIPVASVGLLLACYAGGELLATPFVGGMSDKIGRRPVLMLSTLGVSAGFLILFLSHGALAAALALLSIGVFESVLHPTAMAVVADVIPPADLPYHYGLNRMAGGFGDVFGPALGSLLVIWSLNAVFLAASLILLAAFAVVMLALRETRISDLDEEDDGALSALGAVFHDRRLAWILTPLAIMQIATSWIESVIPLAATKSGALTPAEVGWLFSYAGLLGVIFQMPVLRLCRSMPGSYIVGVGGTMLALAFVALLSSQGLLGFGLAVTGLAFGGIVLRPMVQAVVAQMAPVGKRATYTAAMSAVSDLKDAAGPALGTSLFALATSLPWSTGLALTLLATSGLAFALRQYGAIRSASSR